MALKNQEVTLKKILEPGYPDLSTDAGGYDVSSPVMLTKVFAGITQAQVNTGHVLIPACAGAKLQIVDFIVRFNGTWNTLNDLRLSDTAGTPVDALTVVQAQASGIHRPGIGTHTLGNGFGIVNGMTSGKGLQVRKTGTDAAGGGTVDIIVMYRLS